MLQIPCYGKQFVERIRFTNQNTIRITFSTISSVLLFCIVLASCAGKKGGSYKTASFDTTLLKQFVEKDQVDSFVIMGNKMAEQAGQKQDSKAAFEANAWLLEQYKIKWRNWQHLQNFCSGIMKNGLQLSPVDSPTQKKLAQAFYTWAELSFRNEDRNDDSTLVCLEKALLMDAKQEALPKGDRIYAYKMLGILYNQIGDVKTALNYYTQEAKYIDRKNDNWVASSNINKAIALKELGRIDSAMAVCKQALEYKNVSAIRKADLLIIFGDLQIEKQQMNKALENNNKAWAILDTFKSPSKEVLAKKAQAFKQRGTLQRLASSPLAIVSLKAALQNYQQAGGEEGRELAKLYVELGKCFAANEQWDSAVNSYQVALQKVLGKSAAGLTKEDLYAENAIMEALDARAMAREVQYTQLKNQQLLKAALKDYEYSFEVERLLLSNMSFDTSRMIMLQQSKKRSEKAMAICYQLNEQSKENLWAEQAFLFAENSKAIVLLESVKRNLAANTLLQNDSVFRKVQYLNTRLFFIERSLNINKQQGKDSVVRLLLQERTKLENDQLLANSFLKRNSIEGRAFAQQNKTLTIRYIQEKVLNNTNALLCFFNNDNAFYAFALEKDKPTMFFKLSNSMNGELSHFQQFFQNKFAINNNPQAYQTQAQQLMQNLKVFSALSKHVKTCFVVPDGLLNLLPLEALVKTTQQSNNPKQFDYLLNHWQMNYNYSVATLVAQITNEIDFGGKGLLAVAPQFAKQERGLQPLPNSLKEVKAIQLGAANGTYLSDTQATLSQYKIAAPKAKIIHLATHAQAKFNNMAQEPSIEFIDQSLELSELYNMPLKADLVVLSACETGIGKIDKSEGALSLARGFYYAGASNIITSLWNVDDASTGLIFAKFYEKGLNMYYNEQLQYAKKQYINEASSALASPFYWASFIHIGYQHPTNAWCQKWWLWVLALGLMSLLLYVTFIAARNYFLKRG